MKKANEVFTPEQLLQRLDAYAARAVLDLPLFHDGPPDVPVLVYPRRQRNGVLKPVAQTLQCFACDDAVVAQSAAERAGRCAPSQGTRTSQKRTARPVLIVTDGGTKTMGSEIQKQAPRAPAKVGSDWQSLAGRQDFNPLTAVPQECRQAVAKLWMCNEHLFASSLAICATIRVYLEEQKVTPEDIERIVSRLLKPDLRAGHKFASDVIADLSRMVGEAAKHNESLARLEAMKQPVVNIAETLKLGDLFRTD
ncbi:hypothetical protein [Gemmata sp. SH-PL17]|uniref:hypothetical protein n=1 Tax=Gemmata sp. SH-PL17 TaxID=1630693 RepID=UPI0012FAA343|nr:hypothetical protein [Gemmata sp. SH-PL17]